MPSHQRGLLFGNDGALVILPRPTTIPASDPCNAGWRTTNTGLVYTDAVNAPGSTSPRMAGVAISDDGAVFITEAAPDGTSSVVGGLAISATGALHVTFTKPTGPAVVNGAFRTSNTGQVYVAGMLEAPAAAFMYGMGITQVGGFVSQWDDQSGNARHLKQATATNQPAVQSDNSILFDGVDNYLKCDAFTLAQPETVYLLFKQVTWTLNDVLFDGNTLSSGRMLQSATTPRIRILGSSATSEDANLAVNTYGAVASVFNGATSLTHVNLSTPVTGNVGTGDMSGFTLGANGTPSVFGHIQVKEALIYADAHDATQRARVINYLNAIGGLGL